MNNFIFNIQIARYNHKGQTYRAYIVSFAPKDSNQWIVLGAFNSFKEADDIIKTLTNLDNESLKKIFDYKCERVFWRFEKEIEETSDEEDYNEEHKREEKKIWDEYYEKMDPVIDGPREWERK